MKTKFTKGPLIYLTGDNLVYTKLNDGCRGMPIARIESRLGESDANGHLFSASPELYAACEDARKYLINEFEEPGRTVFWNLVAALKKARGEK